MKQIIFILTLVILLSGCGVKKEDQLGITLLGDKTNIKELEKESEIEIVEIKIRDKVITAEVAKTPQQRVQGLSNKAGLGENEGLLFIFNQRVTPVFWMKEMLFSIDIIWIDGNEIMGFSENLPIPADTNGEIKRVQSKNYIDRVLEVNAGFVAQNGLKIGDIIEIIEK